MSLELNTGATMPILGLGTFQATKPGEAKAAVIAAIESGYRLIDCAGGYKNEHEVGEAIQDCIGRGLVKREDLFIVSKLFQTNHVWGDDEARCQEALDKTLADLQVDYLDLYLIHWPFAFEQKVIDFPLRDESGAPNEKLHVQMEYLATWKQMESFVASGKTKAIGVSNFTQLQLEQLLSSSETVPAVNQIEIHPYLSQVIPNLKPNQT